ncbi:MAG: hypothetical protein LKE31_02740 [Bacilli bacterium]|jgi:hypothetical protein|nr:hypothetical protein [Bacilli bacterium]
MVVNVFSSCRDYQQLKNETIIPSAILLAVNFLSETSNLLSSFSAEHVEIEICNPLGAVIDSEPFDKLDDRSLASHALIRSGSSIYLNLYLTFFSSPAVPSKNRSHLVASLLSHENIVILSFAFSSENCVGVKSEGTIRLSGSAAVNPKNSDTLVFTIKEQSVSIKKIMVDDLPFIK